MENVRPIYHPHSYGSMRGFDGLWLLGADDPEMRGVSELLAEEGFVLGSSMAFALSSTGHRVNAQEAANFDIMNSQLMSRKQDFCTIEIEFSEASQNRLARANKSWLSIDHHSARDFPVEGYPVEGAVMASSLGRLAYLLGLQLSPANQVVGAKDHNFSDAVKGKTRYIVDFKSGELGDYISSSDVLKEDIDNTIEAHKEQLTVEKFISYEYEYLLRLQEAPVFLVGSQWVVDLSSHDIGKNYSPRYMALRSAIYKMRGSNCVALTGNFYRDENSPYRLFLMGHSTGQTTRFFYDKFTEMTNSGLILENPAPFLSIERGYAGGYIKNNRDMPTLHRAATGYIFRDCQRGDGIYSD